MWEVGEEGSIIGASFLSWSELITEWAAKKYGKASSE